MDVRFADSLRLPAAVAGNNTFQSIENSPTAFGYEVAVAQFNGFLGYDCDNLKGVQKVRWDTTARRLELAWANRDVNLNGVLTYSHGSGLVYSSGKEADCNYYLYGLDWATGEVRLRQLLGPEGSFTDDPYYDAGNGLVVMEDGTLYYSGGASLVAVDPQRATSVREARPAVAELTVGPNPTRGRARVTIPEHLRDARATLRVTDTSGRVVRVRRVRGSDVDLHFGHGAAGVYAVRLSVGGRVVAEGRVVVE